LWETDLQGRFTSCEGKVLDLLGLSVGEVVGHLVGEIFSSDVNAKIYLERALAGESVAGELAVGATQLIQSAGPLRNQSGSIIGARGVALDITAQRLAEESAQAQGDLLKTVIDTALDALVTIDSHGRIELWNKQAELLFGGRTKKCVASDLMKPLFRPRL
jgi:PAS domain-containing protein